MVHATKISQYVKNQRPHSRQDEFCARHAKIIEIGIIGIFKFHQVVYRNFRCDRKCYVYRLCKVSFGIC